MASFSSSFPSATTPPSALPPLPATFKSHVGDSPFMAYTGAGISVPAPSCIPSWKDLASEIIVSFFTRVKPEWVPPDFTSKLDFPPEMVFESFGNVLGDHFYECFHALDLGKPNSNHQALAAMAKAGKLRVIWTTNFDEYLEMALREAGVDFTTVVSNEDYDKLDVTKDTGKVLVCKIHGTTSQPSTIVAVASAYKGSSGFSASKARVMEAQIKKMPLLFLGYSGWDFEHSHYMSFWEIVGPAVKQILFNVRPGDTAFPHFDQIFKAVKNIQFVASELPQDLILAAPAFTPVKGDDAQWGKLKEARGTFLNKWAAKLSETHVLALAMTTAMIFSERSKAMGKAVTEMTEGSEASSTDQSQLMTQWAADMAAGKLTMEEYMTKINDYMEEASMTTVPKSKKPLVRQWIKDDAVPGIRSDLSVKGVFLGRVATLFLAGFTPDETLAKCKEWAVEDARVQTLPESNEKTALRTLQAYLATYANKDEAMEKKYTDRARAVCADFVQGKMKEDKFYNALTDITIEMSRDKSGVQVAPMDSFNLLNKEVSKHVKDDEQLVVYALTLTGLFHHYLFGEIAMWEETKALYEPANKPGFLEKDLVESPFFVRYSKAFAVMRDAVAQGTPVQRGCVELPFLLMLCECVRTCTRPNWKGQMPYYGGYVNLASPNLAAYNYVKKNMAGWIEALLAHKNTNLVQKTCEFLTEAAQLGDDVEMAKRACTLSLKASDGKITEATPINIPITVASMIEIIHDKPLEALPYYTKGLAGLLLSIPSQNPDILVYRCVDIISSDPSLSAGEKKKRVVEIMAKYALKFNPHMRSTFAVPARALAEEKAQGVCMAADGGKSLEECVKEHNVAMNGGE